MADHDAAGGWDLIVAPWHLDEHIPAFPVPAGAAETICPSLPDGTVAERMTVLHRAVAGAVARAGRPLVLSGDCPAALGAVAGLQGRYRDLAVVWLDAHGDFNTPAITISGYLGGMALAMLAGRTPGLFRDALGLRPVADTDIVLADARDLDPAERDSLAASQVRRAPADPAAISAALGELRRMPVYLHLDVDVIDSAQLSGLRFPSGPGPSITQIEECLAAVCATADEAIACAWLPDRVNDQATREAITRLAGALGADLACPHGRGDVRVAVGPGAWHTCPAWATMPGWLVMTAGTGWCGRVVFMSVLDGTRPSGIPEWVSPVAPLLPRLLSGPGTGPRAAAAGPGRVGKRCWLRAGGVGPWRRSADPGRGGKEHRAAKGPDAQAWHRGAGYRRPDGNLVGPPAMAERSWTSLGPRYGWSSGCGRACASRGG